MEAQGDNTLITVNKLTVCYDDRGKGKVPLIFIHGFPFDKSSWHYQMDHFMDIHRVIAYDLRGFGKSIEGEEKFSIGMFADDLVGFMDALQIPKAIICGLSMGGYIALNAVSRYAGRFEALVLCDTQCAADSDEAKENRNKSIAQLENNEIHEFMTGFIKAAFCTESMNKKQEEAVQVKQTILSTSRTTLISTLHAMAERWETCSILGEIRVPALILCGRLDTLISPAQSGYLHDHIKNSEFHFIEKSGHLPNIENPEEFNRLLQGFLSGLKK